MSFHSYHDSQHSQPKLLFECFLVLKLMGLFKMLSMTMLPIAISWIDFHATEALDDGVLVPFYYTESCPQAEKIVREQVLVAVRKNPGIAASLLRLQFHDCFVLVNFLYHHFFPVFSFSHLMHLISMHEDVLGCSSSLPFKTLYEDVSMTQTFLLVFSLLKQGCDASVLLDSEGDIESEKEAGPNLNSLRGFEVVDKIKELLEKECPETVSCADILAFAARDAVELRGGLHWEVELGRRDSLKASLSGANQFIPRPNSSLDILIANFEARGLSLIDLVTLSGSHTIGRSRCLSFKQSIYEETDAPASAQEYNHHETTSMFRRILRSICPRNKRENALVSLDFMTPNKFDNAYYHNLLQGKGLLESDNVLLSQDLEGQVAKLVWTYASNQHRFFKEFAVSMVKMGRINPLTGEEGEIRRNCRFLNSWSP